MEWLVVLAVVAVTLGVSVAAKSEVDAAPAWAAEATRRGLVEGPTQVYTGEIDGFAVRLEERRSGRDARMVATVAGGGLPADAAAVEQPVFARGRAAAFDDALTTPTFSPAARAWIAAQRERLIAQHVEPHRCVVLAGAVICDRPRALAAPAEAAALLDEVLAIARHRVMLEQGEAELLATIARQAPSLDARLEALEELRAHPAKAAVVLRELLAPTTPPALRLKAADAVGDEPTLSALLDVSDARVAVGACAALAARGRDVQPRLIALLSSPDAEARTQAAQTLGRHGTVAAVEPLLAFAERASAVVGTGPRAAAQEAVAQIQARLTGAAAGQLSLASPDHPAVGAVTVVDPDTSGAVTLLSETERPRDPRDAQPGSTAAKAPARQT